MLRFLTSIILCAGLTGCLGGFGPKAEPAVSPPPETRAEGTPAPLPEDVARALPRDLPRAAEVEPPEAEKPAKSKPGFFKRVFGRDKDKPSAEATPKTGEAEATSEAGDTFDTAVADPAPKGKVVEVAPEGTSAAATEATVATTEKPDEPRIVPQSVGLVAEPPAPKAAEVTPAVAEVAPAPKRGLLAMFRKSKKPPKTQAIDPIEDAVKEAVEAEPEVLDAPANVTAEKTNEPTAENRETAKASLEVDVTETGAENGAELAALAEEPASKKPRNSRAARKAAKAAAATKQSSVPLGTVLPFGEVAVQCAAKGRKLGKEIDRSSAKHTLYDTAPGSSAPHTFFVTGFKDRCARQFTASLALFGDLQLYEVIHSAAVVAPAGRQRIRPICGCARAPAPLAVNRAARLG